MNAVHNLAMRKMLNAQGRHVYLLACALFFLALLFGLFGLCVGSTGFDPVLVAWWRHDAHADMHAHALVWQIVREIRLPRTLGAWAAGALLGLAGALAQGVLRNPLADPYLLGSAAGASLGVALVLCAADISARLSLATGLVFVPNVWAPGLASQNIGMQIGLTGAAFLGASLAALLTLTLARGAQHTTRLLLAGVVVGVLLGAITHLVLVFSPQSLQTMQTFMLGSTSFVGLTACVFMLVMWLVCALFSTCFARVLDGLSLGEATAQSLGLAVAPLRLVLLLVLALATATAVAQTGLIAFVGLAAPHLVRALVRTTHTTHIWLCSAMGGVLLLLADLGARWILAPHELPVGVITAVLGGGYLLYLMQRGTHHALHS